MTKFPILSGLILCVASGCVNQPSLRSELLDSASAAPAAATFTMPDLRLGDIRYTRDRFLERETVAWYFTPDGAFGRGVPRQDQEEYDSFKVRIYEVGVIEGGRYRGFALERWDVAEDVVLAAGPTRARHFHHYFLRNSTNLIHLPSMAKGAPAQALWDLGPRGKQVVGFLRAKWDTGLSVDRAFRLPELQPDSTLSVPGEGIYVATAAGEAISATEARLGAPVPMASLARGREIYRVPGDWIVCVYPDGLAVHLKRQQ